MGLFKGRFSVDSTYTPTTNTTPNPNKFIFEVLSERVVEDLLVALVHYPQCTTYGGNKLLVIKGVATLKDRVSVDPHFLEDGDLDIVARFKADADGIALCDTFLFGYTQRK